MKLLESHKVLTNGSGSRRVVLCLDSGLVYKYSSPEEVTAVFDGITWVVAEPPRYSSGGWGRGSTGDAEGHYAYRNTLEVLRAIDAQIRQVNLPSLMSLGSYRDLLKADSQLKKLNKNLKKLGLESRHVLSESFKGLEFNDISKRYRDKQLKAQSNPFETLKKMRQAVEVFKTQKGKSVTIDGYLIEKNKVSQGETVVAFRDSSNKVFLNSQLLRTTSFESSFLGGQSIIQKELRAIADFSIPFNVLSSANLKLDETKVIDQGPEEDFTINGKNRHFTGAMLLENSGRKFLMDIDRIEIRHGIFNAFFVEVSGEVKTLADAYESMKPETVKQAESQGIEVRRQGEWFFIDLGKTIEIDGGKMKSWEREYDDDIKNKVPRAVRSSISHGKGRPNMLYKPLDCGEFGENVVCGTVSHTGREHKDLDLGTEVYSSEGEKIPSSIPSYNRPDNCKLRLKLWTVVPNTTVGNFTIQGDID